MDENSDEDEAIGASLASRLGPVVRRTGDPEQEGASWMDAVPARDYPAPPPTNVQLHQATAEELIAALAQVSAVQQERISGNALNIVREAMRTTREQQGDFCHTILEATQGQAVPPRSMRAPL